MFETITYIDNALQNLYMEDSTAKSKKLIELLEECKNIYCECDDTLSNKQGKM